MLGNDALANIYPPEVLQDITWKNPTEGNDGEFIQDKIDQFAPRVPFRSISEPKLQIPQIYGSSPNLFLESGTALDFQDPDLRFDEETFEMKSVGTILRIASSTLGTQVPEQKLALIESALHQTLRRFYSVALIYGGYGNSFLYYGVWNQSAAFKGMQMATTTGNGYSLPAGIPLSLATLDTFLTDFRSANNGQVDYLVMNTALRLKYLELWRAVNQLPEYTKDPITGRNVLAHDGIPILSNDYILNYEAGVDNVWSPENPEPGNDPEDGKTRTSLYAVVCGPEKQGMFGVHPKSFGQSPIKIERSRSSEIYDSIDLRGMLEAGLALPTQRSIGRLYDIHFS